MNMLLKAMQKPVIMSERTEQTSLVRLNELLEKNLNTAHCTLPVDPIDCTKDNEVPA
jgi:hypothetical protein